MDTPPDDEGGKWLSYSEIAVLRGISRASAERLVRRRRWRRLPDNHGVVRAYVPPEWTEPAEMRPPVYHGDSLPDTPPDNGRDTPPDITPAVRAFETALAEVKAAKDEQIFTLRGDLAKERGRIAELISQIGDLESRLHHESRVAKEALEVADQLRRADAERRGRGRWARLREAWKTVKPDDATTVMIHNRRIDAGVNRLNGAAIALFALMATGAGTVAWGSDPAKKAAAWGTIAIASLGLWYAVKLANRELKKLRKEER